MRVSVRKVRVCPAPVVKVRGQFLLCAFLVGAFEPSSTRGRVDFSSSAIFRLLSDGDRAMDDSVLLSKQSSTSNACVCVGIFLSSTELVGLLVGNTLPDSAAFETRKILVRHLSPYMRVSELITCANSNIS